MEESFVYRCPVTGMSAQVYLEFQPASDERDRYELVSCPACQRAHLVNVATGKLLSEEQRPATPTGRARG